MIRNLSYNDKKIREEVDEAVGKSYSFMQKWKMKGNGSQRFLIVQASQQIQTYLDRDKNLNHCNIELRPNGIIVRFRSVLETMGWVIPYHQLSLFDNGGALNLYAGTERLSLRAAGNQNLNRNFWMKMLDQKSKFNRQYNFIES